MFNNTSDPWVPNDQTSAPEFARLIACYRWHLKNNSASVAQAHEACSAHEGLVRLGAGMEVVFWLMGILILIGNAAVLLGIICTRQLRHRPIYIYLANLAVTDVFAGIGLLYRTVGQLGHSVMYGVISTHINLISFSQLTSASALCLMSINSYVAVKHPAYFHIHAGSAKLRAVVTLTVSWAVFSLLAFSPSMGWDCLQMQTLTTGICISWYPLAFVIVCASILLLLCIVMLFTNVSVYVAIREREKRRLEQAAGLQAAGGNGPGQNLNAAQQEAQRKYEERVYKARTVMIHVVVAFVCWLLPLLFFAVCKVLPDICPRYGVFAGICLNSLINPIATLIRTPDLRNAIWQKLTSVHQTLVRVIRGNRADPQEDQAGTGDVPSPQEGPANREGQNTPRLAPDEQSAVGNLQEGSARGEGQDTPRARLAPDEQSAVEIDQEGPAHREGQNTPRLAPDEQSAVGNRQEGPALGEGQNSPRLAPGEQSAVKNRHCQTHTYQRTPGPYKTPISTAGVLPTITIVEID